jgi:aspartate aminotransferase
VALGRFLADEEAVDEFQRDMNRRVHQRLDGLYSGFTELKRQGYPVDCIEPQGAIYLSLRLDLVGRTFDGRRLEGNEEIRRLLLDRAGLAVIPFRAFGLEEDTGWFRLSVGALTMEDVDRTIRGTREVLDAAGLGPA